MSKYGIDIDGVITLKDINEQLYVDSEGEVGIVLQTQERIPPIMRIGGQARLFVNHAQRIHQGTPIHTFDTGIISNTIQNHASAFFYPVAEKLTTLFSGPTPFIENPGFLFGALIIIAAISNEDTQNSYSKNYEVLPTRS
jgi:hypothetical protein